MPTQTFGGTPLVNLINLATGAAFTQVCNASNSGLAARFIAEGGHTSLSGVIVTCTAITTPPTYRISLQGATDRLTPDGTIKNGGTAKVDFVPTVGVSQLTFDTPYTPTPGEALSIVLAYQSGTVGASNTATFVIRVQSVVTTAPYALVQTAGTWATSAPGCPSLVPVYSDGYLPKSFCGLVSATNTSLTNSTNPRYYGSLFTPSIPTVLSAVIVAARPNNGTLFTVSLFEGTSTTAVSSTTVNSDVVAPTVGSVQPLFVPIPSYTLSAGIAYRVVVNVTTATAFVSFVGVSCPTQAALTAYIGSMLIGTTGDSTPSWTDYGSGSDWRVYPVIPCVDSMIAASGSGLLTRRGMNGGFGD